MKFTPTAVLCALVTLASPLAAQDHQAARKVGVGITVPDVGVMLPINVSRHLRVEPFVDFFAARADFPATSDTVWQSSTEIGVGLFSVATPEDRFAVYFGPRIGYLHGSTKVNGSAGQDATTSKGWFVAGAIGAEYSMVPRFSIGGEAKIQFNHASSSSSNGSLGIGPSLFARSSFSSGALVVRFYL